MPRPRPAAWTLLAVAAVAVAATLYLWLSSPRLEPFHLLPAGVLLAALAGWPLAAGWRPFSRALLSCASCGLQYGRDEAEGPGCPACGAAVA